MANRVLRRSLLVTGIVQGVGFRPFVYRLAGRHALTGWVRNTSGGVEIEVEGPAESLDAFARDLHSDAPALARIESVSSADLAPTGTRGFEIAESWAGASTEALIPADVATCSECFAEIAEPGARRAAYPFTNCTNCGPRFTIVERVPYERANTTMAAFEMCERCAAEYRDPLDRRFHAEPIACPVCGPKVWLEAGGERTEDRAIKVAGKLLREGGIVAVKGLGGFHLACDARNDGAVRELRARKGRVAKPFALMVADVAEAERLAELDEAGRSALLSYERPIVLVWRKSGSGVSEAVAPGNRYLGLMLPYTPLHALLFEHAPPALVMTSGNLAEEPLAFTNEAARSKLAALAEAFLMHDREIRVPCDDSVVRPVGPRDVVLVRRARGFVPKSIPLPVECGSVLACGAEQKNTFCLAWDRTAVVSQHIGDLDTAETYDYYRLAIEHFKALCRREPETIAYDLHPDYLSTRYAREAGGTRLVGVQHHHAHIASCLAENGRAEKCIGVALDGTGYSPDGTVWGGEILVADLAGSVRAGHLSQVRLPGGDAAIRDPVRMAAAYLAAAYGDAFEEMAARLGIEFAPLEWRVLRRQLETGLNSPLTSSAGRLFDAVSAAIGVCRERTYEGQPAVELEMIAGCCRRRFHRRSPGYGGVWESAMESPPTMDGVSLFRAAVEDRLAGMDAALVSARFHNSFVEMVARACEAIGQTTGLKLAALSGGVFQNAIVLVGLRERLEEMGFEVLTHRLLPPNDACISYGQAAVAGNSQCSMLNAQ